MLVKKVQALQKEDTDKEADSHTARRDRQGAVWPQFNNALVCHTWTQFVGQISIEGQRGRDKDMQAKQIDSSLLLWAHYTWE